MPLHRELSALVFLPLALVACGSETTTPPSADPPEAPPTTTADVAMVTSDDGYGQDAHSFAPSSVAILPSGTVTWSNNSGVPHNVTFLAQEGAPANIGDQASGSTSRVFDTPGDFSYHCTNHAGMSGRVVVQE